MKLGDAKLTTKQRKSLSGKTFCGPNRSFPVPDCKHAKAALSMIGKYKGPGSKSAIRACVNRKARRMGCFKTSEFADTLVIEEILSLHHDGMLDEQSAYLIITDVMKANKITNYADNLDILLTLARGDVEKSLRKLGEMVEEGTVCEDYDANDV